MKKLLKVLGIVAIVLIIAGTVTYFVLDQPIPKGESGPEAQELSRKMLSAINFEAWQKTEFVHWKFKDVHEYWWDKRRQIVKVVWDETVVVFHTPSRRGVAMEDGNLLEGEYNRTTVKKAIKFFNNDSFWLNGPAKILDPGAELAIVEEDGEDHLLVSYTQGGTTPGDTYLWVLDENGLPTACKMWVKIMPIGGMKASWEDWKELKTGARIATYHQIGPIKIRINELTSEKPSFEPKIRNSKFFKSLTLD